MEISKDVQEILDLPTSKKGNTKTDKETDASVTPLMKQYNAIKVKHPGALLLFRVGEIGRAHV